MDRKRAEEIEQVFHGEKPGMSPSTLAGAYILATGVLLLVLLVWKWGAA